MSDSPICAGCPDDTVSDAESVEAAFAGQRLPCGPAVARNICSRWADRDKGLYVDVSDAGAERERGGTILFWDESPGLTAVAGAHCVVLTFGLLFVVAADCRTLLALESDRENSGGRLTGDHRGVDGFPGFAPVFGMKYACDLASAGDPDVAILVNRQVRAAGGEGVFVLTHLRSGFFCNPAPTGATVLGGEQEEAPADWISREDAVFFVAECDTVEEALRFDVPVREIPSFPTILGEVNAGCASGSGAHRHAALNAECLNVAEIQVVVADLGELPTLAAIDGAGDSGFSSEPANLCIDRANPTDGGRHAGVFYGPCGIGRYDSETDKKVREHRAIGERPLATRDSV